MRPSHNAFRLKYDGVILRQFLYRRDGSDLVDLVMGSLCHLFRHEFRDAIHIHIGTGRPCAFRHSIGHLLDMPVSRIKRTNTLANDNTPSVSGNSA